MRIRKTTPSTITLTSLNHKINRKAMVQNHLNDMYQDMFEETNPLIEENISNAIWKQEDIYRELVSTPVGGHSMRCICVMY